MGTCSILVIRLATSSNCESWGSQAPLVAGDNNQVMIMIAERQDELIRLRREALEAMNPPASNEAARDSGNSPGVVQ
jgi:hypothetical protein